MTFMMSIWKIIITTVLRLPALGLFRKLTKYIFFSPFYLCFCVLILKVSFFYDQLIKKKTTDGYKYLRLLYP